MNKLKKVVSLVLVLTTLLGCFGMIGVTAASSDEEILVENEAVQQAVDVLKALGLVVGYTDGSLGLSKTITRAEFATMVCRLLGVENLASAAVPTPFDDVPQSHWASGYILMAYQQGIIVGYGVNANGLNLFGPEDQVTYEQAMKMFVVALGYDIVAQQSGYPVGYLTVGQQNDMAKDVNGTVGVAIN